ncbi:V-type proton ATPase 16 kDa proteolipid subunit c [Drosophila gunungcola]|uniref:V-type proton ATPase 16 kDa proteolipid subunit c n=1 Tax=Drosophila gunungcola TaxID=103775 RepID=UPI0022E15C3F|nr:V-type proton ATPase 16 kDa proteolipid subunit c [Drosophila gunungcola]XP_052854193.1 V-type proton ATPase 16 kDa proteolipid subunit c [Drosophila gunungcola]
MDELNLVKNGTGNLNVIGIIESLRLKESIVSPTMLDRSPPYSPFFGVMGVVFSSVLTSVGAAYGTAVSGTGIAATAVMRPELVMKSIIPVIMAGIIAIYGLVVSVLLSGELGPSPKYTLPTGYVHMAAGLSVGFAGLAAGYAVGEVGDVGVRHIAQQPRLFIGMILILIFAEVLGLYGLIIGIYLYTVNIK